MSVEIEYDPVKNERNVRERGLSFERARDFEFATAKVKLVPRGDELRVLATGLLAGRVHVLVYKPLAGRIRVISFRKANSREVKRYGAGRRDLE